METSQSPNHSSKCLQACTILGCWFIILPNCIRWIWGSVTVYVSSCLYVMGGHSANDVTTPWLLSVYSMAWTFGVFLYAPLAKRTGKAFTLLLGVLLDDGGILLAYVSVRMNSVAALNFTLGFMAGMGVGICSTFVTLVVSDWAGKHQGLMNALAFCSMNLAAIPISLFITWYLNPFNLAPELVVDSNTFFTQTSLLEKTPMIFLFLLLLTVCFQTLGLILIRHELVTRTQVFENISKALLSIGSCFERCTECCKSVSSETRKLVPSDKSTRSSEKQGSSVGYVQSKSSERRDSLTSGHIEMNLSQGRHGNSESLPSEKKKEPALETIKGKGTTENHILSDSDLGDVEEDDASVTTLQLLRTPSFYALILANGASDLARIWVLNYYKIFGLRFIPDDHFLTDLGTAMNFVAAMCRFTWGLFIDHLGNKSAMLICSSFLCMATGFFFFTSQAGRWVYVFVTLSLEWAVNGYSVLIPVTTLGYYGKTHFGTNFGLIALTSCVSDLSAPFIFQGFLDHYGWFALLIFLSIMNTLAVVSLVFLIPRSRPSLRN